MSERPVPRFVARLMPNASDADLQAATDNYLRYLAIVRTMLERTSHDASSDSLDFTWPGTMGVDPHDV